MKDSKGNTISIGDRVKFLWSFDNKIHTGEIVKIKDDTITIDISSAFNKKMTVINNKKITKILKK